MTDQELKVEWTFRYTERLGLLCGDNDPTPAEKLSAMAEANQAILALSATDVSEENYMTPETTATKLQNL